MRQNLLLLLLLVVTFVQAQQKLYVRGYVLDDNKQAVEFANIAIEGTPMGTASNDKGYYELAFTPADSITLLFSCIGYETVKRTIVTKNQQAFLLNVVMPINPSELEDVEVRAYKPQHSSMQIVDTDKLKVDRKSVV